jgi:hypothetical protein
MELREALAQISEIRQQVAQTAVFRGYRAVPVAVSGLLAILVAGLQGAWLDEPDRQATAYVALWMSAALASILAVGIEMALRSRHTSTPLWRETTWLAVGQFVPSMAAGGLVTLVLVLHARDSIHLLPGLWQLLFSLGIFGSSRLLPRATIWVALFYLCSGSIALSLGEAALSPWVMGLPFGAGQLVAAAILYWTLERTDVEAES